MTKGAGHSRAIGVAGITVSCGSLFLQDGTVPEKNMKIGHEVLPLNSWAKLCQYNAFKELLGSGMNAHLHHNDLLRDIFQMGPAPVHCLPSRESRLERVSGCIIIASVAGLTFVLPCLCRNM